jgi:streptogramin lyase
MKKHIIILVFSFIYFSNFSQTVTTFAGSCSEHVMGLVDGVGNDARFYRPKAIAVDNSGYFYVLDSGNQCVRKISPYGAVTTFAVGTGSNSCGIAVDIIGNVYISDTSGNRILKIDLGSNVPYVLAGNGLAGSIDGMGTGAEFHSPMGIVVNTIGDVFVADKFNHRIRKIDPTGLVTTIAGSTSGNVNGLGTAAKFSAPSGITIDASGNIFVADTGNNQIKKIATNGMVSTYIGNGSSGCVNGIGVTVRIGSPISLSIDSNNNIYFVSENYNIIRMVTALGEASTIAGNIYPVWGACINGNGTNAQFLFPTGILVNPNGEVFVADDGNNTIREITNILSSKNPKPKNQIYLFPNPATNSININFEDFSISKTIILDINGRMLQTDIIKENNTIINVSNLSKGIYLMEITTENGTVSRKIIKS